MAKKIHEEYDPTNYACYAVTDVKEDFSLNLVTPNGLVEYLNYDTYDLGDKTLIAFTKANFFVTDFVYRLISENYTEEILYENYEFLVDVLDGTYDRTKSVFHIMNSQANYHQVLGEKSTYTDDARRCDLDGYAAIAFYDANKEEAADVVDRSYYNNDNILGWTVYLSSMSNIYIVKIDFIELTDRLYKDWPCRVNMAETFPHAMKLAYEWSLLAQEPWNATDSIAVKSKAAFDDWAIPSEVIEEIMDGQPDTSLSLYFNGQDPRQSVQENVEVGPLFRKWFTSRLRYRTLGSLLVNHPDDFQIPELMITKEKAFFEKEIYNFCIENRLDVQTVTAVEILDKAYHTKDKYKERNNSITDIIKKSIYLDDLKSIRDYHQTKKNAYLVSPQNLHR